MILTCPECATSYFVDDSRISPAGRVVKCSSCGARWTAVPDAAEPAEPPEPVPAPATEPAAADELVVEEPEFLESGVEPPVETPAETPFVFRPAPAPARDDGAGKVWVWAISALVVAGLVAAAIVFRTQVVQWLPATGAAYAGLGMPVSGLVIEKVKAEPSFQGGRPVLVVSGQIRNGRDGAAPAPALRVSLLDRAGKPVAAKVAQPLNSQVPGHGVRYFQISMVDPPAGAHDLRVTFARDDQAASKAAAAPVSTAAPDGPAPVDAQPLPPGSPDALPPPR
jgi:predicted Zn finger-like uncharacterized protein